MSLPPWEIYVKDPFQDLPLLDSDPIVCPTCGTSQKDLHRHGHMGCAECYRVFAGDARRALLVLQGTHRHVGKGL
jgi:protein-arginine kinase activator protein McsA